SARETFDLGLYGVNTPEDLRRAAESPFDPYQNYQLSSIANNSNDDARRYLDVAQAAGVTVLVGFDASKVKSGDLDYVRARVRALRDHPAVHGWYEFDEPERQKLDPKPLADAYRAIHEEDPRHPVMVSMSWLG